MKIADAIVLFLLAFIPLLLVIGIWMWASPVGFYQVIIMTVVSIFLYIVFFVVAFTIAVILAEVT